MINLRQEVDRCVLALVRAVLDDLVFYPHLRLKCLNDLAIRLFDVVNQIVTQQHRDVLVDPLCEVVPAARIISKWNFDGAVSE